MKQFKWIYGTMAVVVGIGSAESPVVLAQESATIVEVAAPSAAPAASSAQTLPPLSIWDAQTSGAAQVGPWGNGGAQKSAGRNGATLSVTTRNFEEGARFDLPKGVDIAPYRRTGFWRLRVQMRPTNQPGGGRGGRNQTPGALPATGESAPLTHLRLKLVLDQGTMSGSIPIEQPTGRRNRRGGDWQNLLLGVRNMSATPGAKGLVRPIILTGNSVASFDLEQVALLAETNRITATVRRSNDPAGTDLKDVTLKPGRNTTLVADVNGGTSDLIVQWNFNADNSPAYPLPGQGQGSIAMPGARAQSAGMQGARNGTSARRIDTVGLSARPNWPNEEQDYRVEVTILDRAGRKPAIKKSFSVQVRAGN